jgi:hypothetical protein
MLSDEIYFLIRSFAGSSVTEGLLNQIHIMNVLHQMDKTVEVAGMEFNITMICTCSRACGGIFCEGIKVYELSGNVRR